MLGKPHYYRYNRLHSGYHLIYWAKQKVKGLDQYYILSLCQLRCSKGICSCSSSSATFSPDNSSNVLPFVSVRSNVENTPLSMKNAMSWSLHEYKYELSLRECYDLVTHIFWTDFVLFSSSSLLFIWMELNPICAITAPSLPHAAQIPYAVALYLVGQFSEGIRNVVVLGPKFWKKLAKE